MTKTRTITKRLSFILTVKNRLHFFILPLKYANYNKSEMHISFERKVYSNMYISVMWNFLFPVSSLLPFEFEWIGEHWWALVNILFIRKLTLFFFFTICLLVDCTYSTVASKCKPHIRKRSSWTSAQPLNTNHYIHLDGVKLYYEIGVFGCQWCWSVHRCNVLQLQIAFYQWPKRLPVFLCGFFMLTSSYS